MNAPIHISDTGYRPWLFWAAVGALGWSTLLLYAGGFTTSIQAGMAFLDWPLSNGSLNPEGWTGDPDMRAEHSHRLLGAVMGLLSIGLCAAAFACRASPLLRKVGAALVALVVFQGLLGGLRVLLDQLNLGTDHNRYAQTFAVAHATFAQLYLCALAAFAIAASRSWIERSAGFRAPPPQGLAAWGLVACGALALQLILGAVMRHAHAGLAIPTFPLTPYGTLVPPAFDFNVAIHFAHRVWALAVAVALAGFCLKIWRSPAARPAMGRSAAVLLALLFLQGYLGALTVWTVKNPHAATAHMLNGAILLALCWGLTLRSLRPRLYGAAFSPIAADPPARPRSQEPIAAASQSR